MNTNLLINQIAQELNVKSTAIKEVREWQNVYLVIFNKGLGLRPRFVSKKVVFYPINWQSSHKMFITKYSSAKLLGISHRAITNTWLLEGEIIAVEIQSFKIEYLTLNQYKKSFVNKRQEKAKDLLIDQWGDSTLIVNPSNQSVYNVKLEGNQITCECKDYENQVKAFGRGVCKHGYKLLNSLGHASLGEYINSKKQVA